MPGIMIKKARWVSAVAVVFALIAYFPAFGQPLVQPRGSDSTFELVTWNVHEFPGTGFRTIDTLAILINDLNIDMVALQEIADTNAFFQLLDRLPGWGGLFAPYDYPGYPYLKTGVLWRTDRANLTYIEQLFIGNQYQFPRPPIHVQASVAFGGYQFDFHLIVLHLKADSDEQSRLRRRAAILMLKAYLDNTIPDSPDQDWIIAGDYNDQLEDPEDLNVFWPILIDSTDYRFLTLPMAGDPYWASYPSYNSLIDHILISSDANSEYGSGNTITLRLDDEYSNYRNRISDHRPVMAKFLGYYTSIWDDSQLPEKYGLLDAYPNPFNSSAQIRFSIPQADDIKLEIYDIAGRLIAVLANDHFEAGVYEIDFDAGNLSSGTYLVRFFGNRFSNNIKVTLLK